MSKWEGVTEFVMVAETESFTKAAERLSTSVANISRRVATLEGRLAIKLLVRTTRKVSLTEAGQGFYQACKPLVEGLEVAELNITEMQKVPTGKLKITAPVTYGERKIAPVLQQILQRHPQLALELILTNRCLDLIDNGIDLAIRLGNLEDSSFVAKRLSGRRLYVCATPSYLAQYGQPYILNELSEHHCLVGTSDHWRFKENNRVRTIGIQGRLRCNSGVVLRNAALAGMGLAQLPDYYVEPELASGELVEVLSRYRYDGECVWALLPQNKYLSPKVRLVIDALTAAFENRG